jgi:hypothetical protein
MNSDPQDKKIRISLRERDLRGSKFRCLLLTSLPRDQVASVLNATVSPIATVTDKDLWMPDGFRDPLEARLDDPRRRPKFPEAMGEKLDALKSWWLKRFKGANTPNWDIVSTCDIRDHGRGILLVEAKAHNRELHDEGKPPGNCDNDEKIGEAIAEANKGLNAISPGWDLRSDLCYQMANRFAWAWKLAEIGIPAILVYLGFLNASEMASNGQEALKSSAHWDCLVREHARKAGISSVEAFEHVLQTNKAPMWALIRTLDLKWQSDGQPGKTRSASA